MRAIKMTLAHTISIASLAVRCKINIMVTGAMTFA